MTARLKSEMGDQDLYDFLGAAMSNIKAVPKKSLRRAGLLVLFLVFGLLIFVVFSHMRPMLPQHIDLIGRIVTVSYTHLTLPTN